MTIFTAYHQESKAENLAAFVKEKLGVEASTFSVSNSFLPRYGVRCHEDLPQKTVILVLTAFENELKIAEQKLEIARREEEVKAAEVALDLEFARLAESRWHALSGINGDAPRRPGTMPSFQVLYPRQVCSNTLTPKEQPDVKITHTDSPQIER